MGKQPAGKKPDEAKQASSSAQSSNKGSSQKAPPKPSSHLLRIFFDERFFYGLIFAFFVFYLVSGAWIFGLLIGISIISLLALEFFQGVKKNGLESEIKETAIALLLAGAIWFGLGFVLQTPSPLNAIVSCSMLPNLQRGDLVVLQGGGISAPHATIPTISGIGVAEIYENGRLAAIANGSLYSYCSAHAADAICSRFISSPESFTEKHGFLAFGYGKCTAVFPKSGGFQVGPCVSWLEANNERHYENLSNSIIVFSPQKEEYYSRVGDIIHRAFIAITAQDSGKTYILTKGDNNPIFDIQVYDEASGQGNLPVELSRSKGKVIFRIPYIGYLKLFISPSAIATPPGCDRHYSKWGSG